jgi:16S rRNA (guanine(966)-N(2))-methyltransferase RsmD
MRIIAGTYRGLHLRTLKGGNLRPTSDQMRETLFDVLGPRVEGAAFLDAYAGTGAVGIEALSRGVRDVVFIEHHRAAAQLIRQNLAALGIDSGYAVLSSSVLKGLERLEGDGERFDVIFLDPPYQEIREYHHTLRQLARGTLLNPGAMVVAEHSKHIDLEERYLALHRTRLLRHGDAQLAFYRLDAKNDGADGGAG